MEKKKSMKKCCALTTIILLIILLILLTLYFTILKPKKPIIMATPLALDHIDFSPYPNLSLSLSIRTSISIKNPNYASFKYNNSTSSLFYRGNFVGQAPIEADTIESRSVKNISTVVNVIADKLVGNPSFLPDVLRGVLSMNSETSMVGEVILIGIFRLHVTILSSCDIMIFVWRGDNTADCNSRIKL